jgi:geranylgeranyl diphosphate synthase type II
VSAAAPSFAEYVARQRERVDEALERFLPRSPSCPPIIAEAMRYSVMAGGKRLRPVLTLAAAEAIAWSAGGDAKALRLASARALPCACAIELVHTYSLIHDDLPAMDNDTLRRGRPTLHVVHGEGIAILAGDGLLADAFALLAREPPDDGDPDVAGRKFRVVGLIAEAAGSGGMVGGQAIDLQAAAGQVSIDRAALQAMHARKTGALIRAASVGGGIMGGGSAAQLAGLDRYAAALGLAFQIVDDILDVEGAADELGKTAGKDAASGKPTYPALYGLDDSRRLATETLDRARAALVESSLGYPPLIDLAAWVGTRRN